MPRLRRSAVLAALPTILALGCTHPGAGKGSTADLDRAIVADMDGETLRLNTASDRTVGTFDAPIAKAWPALVAAYAEVGVEANYSDRRLGRYGAHGFVVPPTLRDTRVDALFDCGSTIAGRMVDQGVVTAEVVTQLAETADGRTRATMFVVGLLNRRNGGSSSPITCSSTGRLERMLRQATVRLLAPAAAAAPR